MGKQFGGVTFNFRGKFRTKREAKKFAKSRRAGGDYVRIQETPTGYLVWTRPKYMGL